jgi:RNA methyltransferase, TrmH family
VSAPSVLGARRSELERLRRLVRRRGDRVAERAFVLEGPKVITEALDADIALEAVFLAEPATGSDSALDHLSARAVAAGIPVRTVDRRQLERVADTVTPQPVLAVAAMLDVPLAAVAGASAVVVCVDLQDPGNAGTILRSAEAAGMDAVVFAGASVDPYNPKAVRASAGSLFHVPMVVTGDAVAAVHALEAAGLRVLTTEARTGSALDTVDLTGPVAIVLGNEAHGIPAAVAGAADGSVSIPMTGRSESLNVGMAAAVLCFEVARQRRAAGTST